MLGVELSGPILSELSRTSGHSVRYPSFYLKVHKIENFFDSDFGICVISLLVLRK